MKSGYRNARLGALCRLSAESANALAGGTRDFSGSREQHVPLIEAGLSGGSSPSREMAVLLPAAEECGPGGSAGTKLTPLLVAVTSLGPQLCPQSLEGRGCGFPACR